MFRKQENGRSMIEMLGVLAIIGVLSVGGIAGYTTAMRSHRANEIVNATSMLFMLGLAQNAGEGTGTLTFDTAFGASMRPSGCGGITYKGDKATLDVNIEDETICKQVKIKLGDKAGDCTAATGGVTGYTLTVTLGESTACSENEFIYNNQCVQISGKYDYYREGIASFICDSSGQLYSQLSDGTIVSGNRSDDCDDFRCVCSYEECIEESCDEDDEYDCTCIKTTCKRYHPDSGC